MDVLSDFTITTESEGGINFDLFTDIFEFCNLLSKKVMPDCKQFSGTKSAIISYLKNIKESSSLLLESLGESGKQTKITEDDVGRHRCAIPRYKACLVYPKAPQMHETAKEILIKQLEFSSKIEELKSLSRPQRPVEGPYLLSNGSTYMGQFKDGKMHGYGEEISQDGRCFYSGFWENGQRRGNFIFINGREDLSSIRIFISENPKSYLKDWNWVIGQGTIIYPNKDSFKGEIVVKNGERKLNGDYQFFGSKVKFTGILTSEDKDISGSGNLVVMKIKKMRMEYKGGKPVIDKAKVCSFESILSLCISHQFKMLKSIFRSAGGDRILLKRLKFLW